MLFSVQDHYTREQMEEAGEKVLARDEVLSLSYKMCIRDSILLQRKRIAAKALSLAIRKKPVGEHLCSPTGF